MHRVLELGSVDARELHPVAEPHAVAGSHDHVVAGLEMPDALREDVDHPRGYRRASPPSRHSAVTGSHDQVIADLEILGEDIEYPRGHSGINLEERQRAASTLAKASVHRLEQVVGLVLLDLEVGVPHDSK